MLPRPHLRYPVRLRSFHTLSVLRHNSSTFTNILAGDTPPPVQVGSVTSDGIRLADGLVIPSACIFLEGKVFLWDTPSKLWAGWTKEHLEIFEVTAPKPGKYTPHHLKWHICSYTFDLQRFYYLEPGGVLHYRLLSCVRTSTSWEYS